VTALQSADIDLINRDTALPGLGCVLDPDRLVEAVGKAAFPVPPSDVRLDYVRYRPQRDCVGRFVVNMGDSEHIACAKTFGRSSLRKLEKAAARASVGGPHGAGRLVLPELALLFSWFPNDRKLRCLERLGRQRTRDRLVRRVFKDDRNWLDSELTVLSYKPEKRLVCRLCRPDGRSASVKFYSATEFDRSAHLRRNRSFPAALPVPHYIGGSRKHRVRAFEWLDGWPLREASLDPACDVDLFRRAGKLLAGLQASGSRGLAWPEARHLAEEARSRAAVLVAILPESKDAADECVLMLDRFFARTRLGECPVHADFYDKQVIVGPSRLALIDLDQARMGAAAEDPGCFIAHLELRAICNTGFCASHVERLGQSVLEGYLESGGNIRDRELAGWIGFSLFRLAHQPFRDRLQDWPNLVRAVLERSRELLTDAGLNG